VVSIEGLNMADMTPVQQYMIDEAGTQCGFCTVGFVVSLTSFCLANAAPTYEAAIASIDGNICRCTGYKSIERAAQHITDALANKNTDETVSWLVAHQFLPSYFNEIPEMLGALHPTPRAPAIKMLIGGGTDLYVQKHLELIDEDYEFVANNRALRFITIENETCTLGGGTTVTDLAESTHLQTLFPKLAAHIKLVSSAPIRNISTVAGNFVNASPIGDFTVFFLALNAKITLTENDNNRTIFLKDFYKGYKDLDKTADEIVSAISFEIPRETSQFNLEKVSKRIHLDIATVNTAAKIDVVNGTISEAHIAAGGVGPIPMYLRKTGAFLTGKTLNSANIKAANEVLQSEISPISDVRGTADYKRLLLRQLFFAHFIKFYPDTITLEALK
jgi:xanthine dehydrogenase small subunit